MDINSTEQARRRILIVAEHRRGHGSGHLHRCARLARELAGDIDWLLPVVGDGEHRGREEVLVILGAQDLPVRWVDTPAGPYDMVILDRRTASVHELYEYNCRGIVIGIDVAGEARDYVHYSIDTLEPPPGVAPANISDTGLLHLPKQIRDEWPKEIRSVLVVFGGEERGDEAVSRARELAGCGDWSVTVVTPGEVEVPEGVQNLATRGSLPNELHRFDVVITHFGLTAYEATWARVPVILLNPSPYHERLSRNAGFVTVRNISAAIRRLRDLSRLIEAGRRIRPQGRSSLGHLINDLSVPNRTTSPVTDRQFLPAVERFGERTFFLENQTNLLYMQRFRPLSVSYDHDYFFTDYQKQYGKTYLEDFPHIKTMGERRISEILRRFPDRGTRSVLRLLDIGCAYGPFLQAAAEAGLDPTGVDVSRDAVAYIQRELGFSACAGDIRLIDNDDVGGSFDIVTMWYVIEHFPDLDTVLERVSTLLRPEGLFAFSTPHGRGVSGRRGQREFLRQSPEDHYTIMDRASAGNVLSRFGFQLIHFRTTGHHPERFGIPLGKRGALRKGFRYNLIGGVSRMAGLGDTFEAIAKKVP
ncbi:MAG: methyltransferase domain-containing protein [Alkalispirochaeta sp.]